MTLRLIDLADVRVLMIDKKGRWESVKVSGSPDWHYGPPVQELQRRVEAAGGLAVCCPKAMVSREDDGLTDFHLQVGDGKN